MAKQTTIRLHADVRKEFERMSNIREFGVRKFTIPYILNHLAQRFYKSPKTIENIVFDRYKTAALVPEADLFTRATE